MASNGTKASSAPPAATRQRQRRPSKSRRRPSAARYEYGRADAPGQAGVAATDIRRPARAAPRPLLVVKRAPATALAVIRLAEFVEFQRWVRRVSVWLWLRARVLRWLIGFVVAHLVVPGLILRVSTSVGSGSYAGFGAGAGFGAAGLLSATTNETGARSSSGSVGSGGEGGARALAPHAARAARNTSGQG